jgi:hypothetical protein
VLIASYQIRPSSLLGLSASACASSLHSNLIPYSTVLCYYSQSRTWISLKTTTCLYELPDDSQMILSRICRTVPKYTGPLQFLYNSWYNIQYSIIQTSRATFKFPFQVYLKPYTLLPVARRLVRVGYANLSLALPMCTIRHTSSYTRPNDASFPCAT